MPAELQREREGGGTERLVSAAYPDGDWGARFPAGEGLGLHRTGLPKRVIRTTVPLHQVCFYYTPTSVCMMFRVAAVQQSYLSFTTSSY